MTANKLVTYGCLILALTFCSSAGSPPVSPAAIGRADNSRSAQDTDLYLPFIANLYIHQPPAPTPTPSPTATDTPLPTPTATPVCDSCYYVDSVNGSDTYPGTSESRPWRTLAPVQAKKFLPGNVIHFKRGSSWTGGLVIDDSGVPGNPITFKAYGTGNRPIISNPGDANNRTRAVTIRADWVIVKGLLVRDAFDGGVHIWSGSDYNIVGDNEATNVGRGIVIAGQHNLVTRNYVHDLHMVVNTPGGNDDYGAIGISLNGGSHNEISYNRLINCKAPSYDYGTDGGAVEWWDIADDNYVHHNWANGDNGFLGVGGGSARNTIVAYNVSINNGGFSYIHLTDQFASVVQNFRIENNTIVETRNADWVVLGFNGSPVSSTFLARNNVFYIDGFQAISNVAGFTHHHNLFYLGGGTGLGFTLGLGEMIADPLFVNLAGQDFHLLSSSAAINAGVSLGYTLDFDNHPVPMGPAPDLGAFEYQGTP